MEAVEAILRSRSMGWRDVVRSVTYLKNVRDLPVYDAYCTRKALPAFPSAVVRSDICRDDLLFEIEVDAIQGG
jgi:hypothetical protein